ncbi:MAG: SMP-30/gluconolactonase/LRE family protein [Vicinamibacteria bacterium]
MSPTAARSVLLALSIVATAATAQAPAAQDEARRVNAEARAAHEKGDWPGFLAASRRLGELAPRSTRALYSLACAEARTGAGVEAVRHLDRLARMGVFMDAATDEDLASLRGTPAFEATVARLRALQEPLVASTVVARLDEKDLLTEAVAYDPKTRAFFVSAVHRRKIVRIDAAGRASDFVLEAHEGLTSALGLALDPARRSLYVSTAGQALMRGFVPEDEGRSEVREYGIDDGKLRRRIAPPEGIAGAQASDIALGPDGALYGSDPASGRVYAASPDATRFRVLVERGPIASAQGLTLSDDGRWLFVADYLQGIVRVDPKTGAAMLLPIPEDVAGGGIDGLVFVRGALVGIRNGLRPHAILRIALSAELDRVASVSLLERAVPEWDEPTLGTLAGRDLVYVATSQYERFGNNGAAGPGLVAPVLRRLPLAW